MSVRNMCVEGSLHTSDHISWRGRVRALEDTHTNTSTRHVPMNSPLGSLHTHIRDPYEGISNEHTMEITKPYGITLGSWGIGVANRLRKMYQDRVVECSVAKAT